MHDVLRLQARRGLPVGQQRGVGHQGPHVGVGQQLLEPLDRMQRVQRQHGRAGLEDAQQGRHPLHTAWQQQADDGGAGHALLAQGLRPDIGQRIEFGVAERAQCVARLAIHRADHGRQLRRARGLLREPGAECLRGKGAGRSLRPALQLAQFVLPQHLQRGQRRVGRLRQARQQARKMCGHALHEGRAQQLLAVLEQDLPAVAVFDKAHAQIVARGRCRHLVFADAQTRPVHGARGGFGREEDLEQRVGHRVAGIAMVGQQALERQVLVGHHFGHSTAGLGQQRAKTLLGRQTQQQRQGIDAKADHRFHAGPVASGHRGANDNLVASAVAVEQDGKRCGHSHKRRGLVFGQQGLQRCLSLGRQRDLYARAQVGRHGGCVAVACQHRTVVGMGQTHLPARVTLVLQSTGFGRLQPDRQIARAKRGQRQV